MRVLHLTGIGGSPLYIVAEHVAAVKPARDEGCHVYLAVARSDNAGRPVVMHVKDAAESVVQQLADGELG